MPAVDQVVEKCARLGGCAAGPRGRQRHRSVGHERAFITTTRQQALGREPRSPPPAAVLAAETSVCRTLEYGRSVRILGLDPAAACVVTARSTSAAASWRTSSAAC